jgi:ribosome-associated protein
MEKEGFYLKFQLKEKYIELFKLLKVLDLVDSGAEAKLLIENKHVTRNKELETRKRAKTHGFLSRMKSSTGKKVIPLPRNNDSITLDETYYQGQAGTIFLNQYTQQMLVILLNILGQMRE